jgi:hypothetical protein
MPTEDDTFSRLVRTPFEDILGEVEVARIKAFMKQETEGVSSILKRHGWTVEDYDKELAELHRSIENFDIKHSPNGDFVVLQRNQVKS